MEKDQYVWNPNANQEFTVDTALSQPAATFNKNGGFNCTVGTSAKLSLTVTDDGTTTWGKQLIQDQNPPTKTTYFTITPQASLKMVSPGKLVIGEDTVQTRINVLGSKNLNVPNLQLFVHEVFFSNMEMAIAESNVEMLGDNFSYLNIGNASIDVQDNSTCQITPSFGEKKIDIVTNFLMQVQDISSAQLDGVSVQPGAKVLFNLLANGEPDYPTIRLSGIDFLGPEAKNYPKGMLNFQTYDGKNNRGTFVLAGIGNAYQYTAMRQLQLISIDGNTDPTFINSRLNTTNMYQNGNMILTLRFQK
ncbi:hypothetical protein [Phyllobacterium leguminum]|uniref:Uncharacterized protein n=1 Tax=Phyllobacterium leguminum TaxID=314237 RepID=A0A318T8Q9_9HYPH|nr:hypothetical protein [Phyllobacterium leguminum]PYE89925.1 hypothetical protein C7477_10211 [Phyllobacterium leguminum]